jgi:hypothetical protein
MAHPNHDVVNLISDSEDDEDLKRAIALSLQDQETIDEPSEDTQIDKAEASKNQGASSSSIGILALDRKQMEKERLARLAKRQRETSGQDQDQTDVPPPKRRMQAEPSSTSPAPETTSISSSPSSSELPFPKGVVKRTWAYGYPHTKDDIKIEEVLQRDQLQLAILSSFQWDEEWLLSKINMTKTKLLLVAYAPDEAQVSLRCRPHPLEPPQQKSPPKPCISAIVRMFMEINNWMNEHKNRNKLCATTHPPISASASRP